MQLQKGANAEIDSNIVEISWHATPGKAEVDVSAYLLTGERKVAVFKQIERLEILPGLPRNPVGKVLKRELRAALA